MEYIRQLHGHSGAEVFLYKKEDGTFTVRKKAFSSSYNERLKKQHDKMCSAFQDDVLCPRIIQEDTEEEQYFYDMEFISGSTVAHEIIHNTQSFSEQALVDRLTLVLHHYKAQRTGQIEQSEIRQKIQSVFENSQKNDLLKDYQTPLHHIFQILHSYPWRPMDRTISHGDMTLENIIFSEKKEFVFIDFDEVDLSSAFLDYCKIMQDVMGQWFLRAMAIDERHSMELLTILIQLESLEKRLLHMGEKLFPDNFSDVHAATCLHLFRVLPYIKKKEYGTFVIKRILDIIKQISLVPYHVKQSTAV